MGQRIFLGRFLGEKGAMVKISEGRKGNSSVAAAHKVSRKWSQETMTCHSFNCFSIVWGQRNAPLVTSLPSSCYMTQTLIFFRCLH